MMHESNFTGGRFVPDQRLDSQSVSESAELVEGSARDTAGGDGARAAPWKKVLPPPQPSDHGSAVLTPGGKS